MTPQAFKSRLRIATLALGVGVIVLCLSKTTHWVKQLDASLVMFAMSYQHGEQFVSEVDNESDTITIGSFSKLKGQKNHLQSIHITDDPSKIFEQSPPSALDYAVILTSLYKHGFRDVILTNHLNWDQKQGLETLGLGRQMALFSHSAISMPVTRVATPQPMPEVLQRSLISMSNVTGNHKQLPLVNHAPVNFLLNSGKHTLAGFSEVESISRTEGEIPLLAHWENQGLIPSIDLLAIMIAHKINPSDIRVDCGNYIRLGNRGPLIPVDKYGYTPPPDRLAPSETIAPLAAEQLISPINKNEYLAQFGQAPTIALIHAVGEKTSKTNTLSSDRISDLIALSHQYPITDSSASFLRLPWIASVILLIDVALLSFWFGELTRSKRQLAYGLSAIVIVPLLFVFLAALLYLSQHWLSLSAPLATLITVWCCHIFKRQAKPHH
ncbi:MAG: hypothetical protein P8P36_00595 [Akkermansiaceae bacterium]|nr:hypothetical protein [Akkermansiaceae bacterium]